MALQPDEAQLLRNIYREVGETKVAVTDLSAKVDAHVTQDAEIHERLHARISPLAAESKANSLKHRIAIGLGLVGVGGGAAGATEPGWLHTVLRLFTSG